MTSKRGPCSGADDPDERERNRAEPERPCPPDRRANDREREKRQRVGREARRCTVEAGASAMKRATHRMNLMPAPT